MHPYREQAKSSTAAAIKRAGGKAADDVVNHPHAAKPRKKLATGGAAIDGGATKKRLDKGRGTNVNIIIADKPDAPPAPALPIKPPMAMAPPVARPPMPPMQPPGPPGAPPTGLPPQLAAAALAARANGQPPMKRGGSTIPKMTAGADSGPGRLQEAAGARREGYR